MTAQGQRSARPRRRLVRWIFIVVAAVIVVVAILFVRDALTARDSFGAVMDELPEVEQAVLDGDVARYDDLVAGLQQNTASARASTDGPLWWLAARIPVVGDNAAALTLMAEVIDDVAVDVLPNLGDAAALLTDGGLQFTDAQIDLEPIRQAGTHLGLAEDAMVDIEDRIEAFDATDLVDQIADPFDQATSALSDLQSAITTGHELSVLLPPMLGGDGPRHYLVIAQNSAELRTAGGIAGTMLLMGADDGAVSLERVATSEDVGPFAEPVVELRPGDLEMFGQAPGRFIQDVTMPAQFPEGAAIAAEMWRQAQGETVDGVIAVDPVALSFLLEQVGSIEVDGMALDSSNVVDVLLSDVYREYPDPTDSDAVFAQVAAAVVERVLNGQTDAGALVEAITHASAERRLLIWSAHADEQAVISGGSFGADFDAASTAAGIFFNDGTRGKMSYYLKTEINLVGSVCTAAGRVDTVELRLSSSAPEDAADSLPGYVLGPYMPSDLWGTIRTNVSFFSAVDGRVINITRNDALIGGDSYEVAGRSITALTQDLAPGEVVTFRIDFLAAPQDVTGVTDLWMTPTSSAPGLYQFDMTYCPATS